MQKSIVESQPIVSRILQNSYSQNRLSHAYLFEGQKGTGKMKAALMLTKLFFCQQPTSFTPCDSCTYCKRIDSGNFPDVHIIKPDGQSIKKEQIEKLQHEISMLGMESNKKVYIIEHVDLMTVSAANSLLKFLEEPSSDTMAILITESIHSLLDTIISRCQIMNFTPLSTASFMEQLKNSGIDEGKASILAALTNNFVEAQEMFESDSFENAIIFIRDLMKGWFEGSSNSFLIIQEKWMEIFPGKDEQYLALELITLWIKDVFYLLSGKKEIVFLNYQDMIQHHSEHLTVGLVGEIMNYVIESKKRLKGNVNSQLVIEALSSKVIRRVI